VFFRAVVFAGWVVFLISVGSPHVCAIGRLCGKLNEVEETPIDFVWLTARMLHGAFVREAKRRRIDRHCGDIERCRRGCAAVLWQDDGGAQGRGPGYSMPRGVPACPRGHNPHGGGTSPRAVQYQPDDGQFNSVWLPARHARPMGGGASYVWCLAD